MQSNNKEGYRIGSEKQLILEGLNTFRVSIAGYAKNIEWTGARFYLRIMPIKEHTMLPPAESPAKIIFFGFMFTYYFIRYVINR